MARVVTRAMEALQGRVVELTDVYSALGVRHLVKRIAGSVAVVSRSTSDRNSRRGSGHRDMPARRDDSDCER